MDKAWTLKPDEQRFKENKTQMPATMQQMYDYDSALDMITDKVDRSIELDVNERMLLYNFLEDLKLYRQFYGPYAEVN